VKPCPECGKKFKISGLAIHRARQHGIHPEHLDSDSDSNPLASESKVCPIPWCGMVVPDLLRHFEELHEDWRLSSGKFVFEVV
jgi:hypothetical protein